MPSDDGPTAASTQARDSLERALGEAMRRRRRLRVWLGVAAVLLLVGLTGGALLNWW